MGEGRAAGGVGTVADEASGTRLGAKAVAVKAAQTMLVEEEEEQQQENKEQEEEQEQ